MKEMDVYTENAQLLEKAKLSAQERLDLYALTGHMEDDETDRHTFLNMYLSGDRNWKNDFKSIFGRAAGKK